jgi:hypothetical protein
MTPREFHEKTTATAVFYATVISAVRLGSNYGQGEQVITWRQSCGNVSIIKVTKIDGSSSRMLEVDQASRELALGRKLYDDEAEKFLRNYNWEQAK